MTALIKNIQLYIEIWPNFRIFWAVYFSNENELDEMITSTWFSTLEICNVAHVVFFLYNVIKWTSDFQFTLETEFSRSFWGEKLKEWNLVGKYFRCFESFARIFRSWNSILKKLLNYEYLHIYYILNLAEYWWNFQISFECPIIYIYIFRRVLNHLRILWINETQYWKRYSIMNIYIYIVGVYLTLHITKTKMTQDMFIVSKCIYISVLTIIYNNIMAYSWKNMIFFIFKKWHLNIYYK